jgi:alkanesulfonate monooxygenase SsuD/methylene tetrahydromethanopterin reductase-like flavin-dependent oxidoreductase (luciferase family)
MNEIRLGEFPLQFGLFDWIDWEAQRPYNNIFEERLQMLEYADREGFFCYHLAGPHVTPLGLAPSPGLFLTAAAQRSHRIRLGPLLHLQPFYSPLRLVLEICMLDHLTRGRLELGVGQDILTMDVEKFHIKAEQTWDIFREMLDLLIAAFTNEMLHFEGKYYSFKGIRLWLHPFQQPYPPLWYASTNVNAVPWMAQQGINTIHGLKPTSAAGIYFDLYQRHWQAHRDEQNRLNGHVNAPKLGLARHVYVAHTDAQAEKECRAAFASWADNMHFSGAQPGSHEQHLTAKFDEFLATGVIVAGSPETVGQRVRRQAEEAGVNYFCCIFAFGNLSHAQVMASMHLFVEEVMPAFHPHSR